MLRRCKKGSIVRLENTLYIGPMALKRMDNVGIVDLAREMKHTKVAQLLSQNLKEEKATVKKVEAFSQKVKPNEMMSDEEQQKASSSSRSARGRRAA